MIKKLKEETCPKKMMLMEGCLKRNNDGDGFFIGKEVSIGPAVPHVPPLSSFRCKALLKLIAS